MSSAESFTQYVKHLKDRFDWNLESVQSVKYLPFFFIFQRPLFRHYYKGTDAVVIVIDTADIQRLDELYCDVLKPALLAEELANSVFLFLANKKDLADTIGNEELATVLNLKSVKHTWSKSVTVFGTTTI